MKICKVKITKITTGNMTKYNYPVEYDKEKLSPFIYQNEGLVTEYCLAHVADDFKFTKDMVEVKIADATDIINTWIDSDINLSSAIASGKISSSEIDNIKTKKMNAANKKQQN